MIPRLLQNILIPKPRMRRHRLPPQPLLHPLRPLNPLHHLLPPPQKLPRSTHASPPDHRLEVPFRRPRSELSAAPRPEKRPGRTLPPARALLEAKLTPEGHPRGVGVVVD